MEQGYTYTCNDFEVLAAEVHRLRAKILLDLDEAGTAPVAEQHYLAAISLMEQASINLKLAHYHQMQGR